MNTDTKKEKPVATSPVSRNKYDSAWKHIIRSLFKDFLEFLYPEIHETIDFSKKITFLDKELHDIQAGSPLGDRVADMLVRVHLKEGYSDGGTQLIRIIAHIEVQGNALTELTERMFIYFYRAYDKEKQKNIRIISLLVLTDEDPTYRPDRFGYKFCGFQILMEIPIVKLMDYKYNPVLIAKLENSHNPIALVVKSQLKSLELKGADSEKKFEALKELIRLCYKQKYSSEYTHFILKFFELTIRVPDIYKKSIRQVVLEAEEEFKMDYELSWVRDAANKAAKKAAKDAFLETAKNLLKMGLDIGKIADATGLKKAEIEKLGATAR